ncbi:NAD(+) diphosphatase [Marinagarivorans algicola]|uniref:NAD(+) diphosphatase n=1 Tax=Marinagarivorans algicola TaxID=1513270 RepID=UPI0006B8D504|nr:NAD(+) diphosphatase [Marinagarivorans algicola]
MSTPKVWLHLCNGQIILAQNGSYLHSQQPLNAAVFLPVGLARGQDWWLAIAADTSSNERNNECTGTAATVSLRQLLGETDEATFALLSRASQLAHWWQQHQFCGRCGAKQQRHHKELALECMRCQHLVYPRISPCMIVLVTRGRQILLAKHARSRSNWYSCLAGFVEVGESVEHTVMREVQEEVGLQVSQLEYQASQNWPFPSQLMLGFWAQYAGGDICVDGVEIEDAAWFDCDDLPQIPPSGSIAHTLITQYCATQKND